MPNLPVSNNEAMQRKIDSLPENEILVFKKDTLYVNPSWRIRKSITMAGELRVHLTGGKLRPIFVFENHKDRFISVASAVVITSDRDRRADWDRMCGSREDRPLLVEIV
jgi:hypothetical protein